MRLRIAQLSRQNSEAHMLNVNFLRNVDLVDLTLERLNLVCFQECLNTLIQLILITLDTLCNNLIGRELQRLYILFPFLSP